MGLPTLLVQMFPIDAGKDPETLRRRVLRAGAALEARAAPATAAPAATISVTLDGTFVRSCEPGERHLEVRVGNVETSTGARQVFAAVAGADTDIAALIRGNLTAVGHAADTTLTAFTDGCPGLRNILADAGIRTSPMLDWFHIAMRLNHLKQIADAISTTNAEQEKAKAAIVDEVERLRWRLWNGKATNARVSIDRIHAVMCRFRGEHSRKNHAASRRASCGQHCTRWTNTWLDRTNGWSTTPRDTAPVCGLALRLRKAQPTFW
jgi:hypothetical protein